MPNWTQFQLEVEASQAEAVAQILLDAGCTGTQVDDVQVVLDDSEDASFAPRSHPLITGYLEPNRDADEAQSEIEERLRAGEIAVTLQRQSIDDSDWSTNWRENFPPLEIGRFRRGKIRMHPTKI